MKDITTEIRSVQEKIDSFLLSYLQRKEQSVLVSEITRSVKSGGKRIRPFILYKTYQVLGGKDESLVIKIGAAIELFHTFALIHDDIIDRSNLRRNTPTVRKQVGDNTAILVGDMSLVFAQEVFNEALSSLPQETKIQLQKQWQTMQEEVLIGEYFDSYQTIFDGIKQTKDLEELERECMNMMEYKTARYTIVHPLLFAALLVTVDKKIQHALSEYGTKVGVAFQIKDDLLGIFGDEKTIGKPVDSDVKEGKITLLILELLKRLTEEERTRENISNLNFVQEKMKKFKIDQLFQNKITVLTKEAEEKIQNINVGQIEKQFFHDVSEYLVSRDR